MKKGPEFDSDVRQAIETDPEFAAEYFAELAERLGARLVMIPSNMVLVPKAHWRKVRGAQSRSQAR